MKKLTARGDLRAEPPHHLCRALSRRPAAGRVDPARRRSRNACFGHAEAQRRPADELPARVGRGRRGARALLDHRHRTRHRLARVRRPRRDQPRAADATARLRARARADARVAARAAGRSSRIELPPDLPPMAAGVFGYMGYDTVRLIEHLPNQRPDALAVPDGILVRPDRDGGVRRGQGRDDRRDAGLPAPGHRCATPTTHARRAPAQRRARPRRATAACDHLSGAQLALPEPVSNTTPAEFMAMVARAKDYIAAGDIFQVVLSQRFSAPFTLPPFALYRALRRTNPSPFLFHLDFGALRAGRLQSRRSWCACATAR